MKPAPISPFHFQVHLFDIDIPGKITFKESEILSPGNSFTSFATDDCKIGVGICYDIRFAEMALVYRDLDCKLLVVSGSRGLVVHGMLRVCEISTDSCHADIGTTCLP